MSETHLHHHPPCKFPTDCMKTRLLAAQLTPDPMAMAVDIAIAIANAMAVAVAISIAIAKVMANSHAHKLSTARNYNLVTERLALIKNNATMLHSI